jgi:hypothetical protein
MAALSSLLPLALIRTLDCLTRSPKHRSLSSLSVSPLSLLQHALQQLEACLCALLPRLPTRATGMWVLTMAYMTRQDAGDGLLMSVSLSAAAPHQLWGLQGVVPARHVLAQPLDEQDCLFRAVIIC